MAEVDDITYMFGMFDDKMMEHAGELTDFFVKWTENPDYELAVGALRYMSKYAGVGMIDMDTWIKQCDMVYAKFKDTVPDMKDVMSGILPKDRGSNGNRT